MFKWLFSSQEEEKIKEEIYLYEQINQLWTAHNRLSEAVFQVSECMKKIAEAGLMTRKDLEFLGENTMRLAEAQNKLAAHIMRNEDLILDDKIKSPSLH